MKSISDIGAWFKRMYDKVLVLVVFAALAVSVVVLVMRVGSIQKMDREYERKLDGLTPKHPEAAVVASDVFDAALARLKTPPRISGWTNDLTVPETRVWCIHCRQPIPYNAENCPICEGKQPPADLEKFIDTDGDGMPDGFELEQGLNPKDPSDAKLDADGDLFTNLDEYTHKTNLSDPNEYPPIEVFLEVAGTTAIPFDLLFKSHMRGAGDARTFAINTSDGGKTFFVKLGDTVEGFEVVRFDLKQEDDPSVVGGQRDVSVLTLRKGTHEIPLVRGAGVRYEDFTVELFFRLENRSITAKLGDVFALRTGRVYKVMEVDTNRKNVVIERQSDRKLFTIVPPVGGDNG